MADQNDPERKFDLASGERGLLGLRDAGEKQRDNDAHRFLRVVAAMAEAVQGGGDQLRDGNQRST